MGRHRRPRNHPWNKIALGGMAAGVMLIVAGPVAVAAETDPPATTQGGPLTDTGIAVGGMLGKPGQIAGGAAGGAADGALSAASGTPTGSAKIWAENTGRLGAGAGRVAGPTGEAAGGQAGYIAGGAVGGGLDGTQEGANEPGWWDWGTPGGR